MEHDLTKGSVSRVLIRFAVPFMLSTLLQELYGVVDLMIVGRFSSAACITAVNSSGQLTQLFTSFITGLASGGTVLIAQYIGAGRRDSAARVIRTLFALFAAFSAVIMVVLGFGTPLIVRLMQVPEEAVIPARQYLYICTIGIPFIAAYNGNAAILRGLGDSKTPMYFIAVSCILNIIGDLVLVGGFGLDAAGAAAATVGAQSVSAISAMVYLLKKGVISREAKGGEKQASPAGKILGLGIPLAAQNTLVDLSFLIITVVVNRMGVSEGAAVGVVERLINFAMLVPISFLHSLSAFAAQNMGAKQKERAVRGMKYAILMSVAVCFFLFLAGDFFGRQLVGLFTTDASACACGAAYLHTYRFDIMMTPFVFCMNGFFSGCGRTKFTMANGLIATFCVRVPLVILISLIPGTTLLHIGIAAPVASFVQILMEVWYYRARRWDKALIA